MKLYLAYFEQLPDVVLAKVHRAAPGGRMVIMHQPSLDGSCSCADPGSSGNAQVCYAHRPGRCSQGCYVALSKDFSQDLTSDEIDHPHPSLQLEEDLWMLKQFGTRWA